ncbi:hypothetical protein CYMTET_25986 [Cymbomonas tetramitiformis]|uniref:Uncharacterized protein n=1 Tax=Cymbomonas tetramitiformis TaxID=36881 RepID=A0AAE0FTG1_9CHLO|nr:hypothetical protein CYMTET_25986 [Cymbomonas tetramitiformis]
MCDELSACSFDITVGGAASALGKYAAYCQPVDTSMGGFRVGGAADGVASFTDVKIGGEHVGTTETPPPPPLSGDGVGDTADDHVYPASDLVHFDNQTFANIIAKGPLAVQHEEVHLHHAWMIDNNGDNNTLLDDSESDEDAALSPHGTDSCLHRCGIILLVCDSSTPHRPGTRWCSDGLVRQHAGRRGN